MKKFFVFLLAVMAVMSVNAQTKLTLGGQSANGNWSWGTTKTMGADVALHFGSQWGEFTLAAEPGEATGCKLVVAEPNAKVNLVVKHADGNNEYIAVDAAEKNVTFASAATLVELQATEAAQELEVKSFVLVAADGTETQTSYKENWGVSTYGGIYTSTSQWAQVMLNGAEQADPQIIKFHCNAPVPAGLQLKVINEDGSESYLQLTEGETEPAIEIDNAVKEVSLQFTVVDATIDIAYVTTEPVATPALGTVVSFGSKDDARFAQQTQMSGVASAALACADGTTVTVASNKGKYWSHAIVGTWTNQAAVDEVNNTLGSELTTADFAAGSPVTVSMAGAQGNNSTLTFDFANQPAGQLATIYTTVSYLETKAPLDNITVTGLKYAKVSYAVGDGDGFVETPTFCAASCGLTLVKIVGLLTGEQVVVSSTSQWADPSVEGDAAVFTPKVGYQIAGYKVAELTEPIEVASWTATACKQYPASWGWASDQLISGYDCTFEQYTDGTCKVLGWDGVEGDDITITPNQWGIDAINGSDQWASMYMGRSDYYYTDLWVPYSYVGGLGEESGYVILYGYMYKNYDDPGSWGTVYLAWGDNVVIPVAEAEYAKTEDTKEPAVAVTFNKQTTCFVDAYKSNETNVTLVDANGTSYDIVRTSDNYCLEDYSCTCTSFILGAELPAGDYTLTIPAGTMVVDDPVDMYVFNKEDYVLNFSYDGSAAGKLINKNNVDAINNVAVQSTSVKKALRNGKLVIVKGNNEYNAAGALLK